MSARAPAALRIWAHALQDPANIGLEAHRPAALEDEEDYGARCSAHVLASHVAVDAMDDETEELLDDFGADESFQVVPAPVLTDPTEGCKHYQRRCQKKVGMPRGRRA